MATEKEKLEMEIKAEVQKEAVTMEQLEKTYNKSVIENAFDAKVVRLQEKARQEKLMNERVPIRLMKDSGKYQSAVEVCWNGKIFQLQRGENLMIPRGVMEILMSSEHQDLIALEMQDRIKGDVYLGAR